VRSIYWCCIFVLTNTVSNHSPGWVEDDFDQQPAVATNSMDSFPPTFFLDVLVPQVFVVLLLLLPLFIDLFPIFDCSFAMLSLISSS
jgi:hypothetical protein